MKIDFKGKVNSSILASIILSFAIVFILVLTTINVLGIRSLAQERQEERTLLEMNQLNLSYLGALERQSTELEKELESTNLLLPKGVNQGDLIYRFNELGDKYPGQILNLVFEDEKIVDGDNTLQFKAVYKGNYADFITILYDISTWSRLVFVDEIAIKSDDSQKGVVSATIWGKAFFR